MKTETQTQIKGISKRECGAQNMISPNMAPWHFDNFKLKELGETAESERSSDLPPFCLLNKSIFWGRYPKTKQQKKKSVY
jgi:hypothetical protein